MILLVVAVGFHTSLLNSYTTDCDSYEFIERFQIGKEPLTHLTRIAAEDNTKYHVFDLETLTKYLNKNDATRAKLIALLCIDLTRKLGVVDQVCWFPNGGCAPADLRRKCAQLKLRLEWTQASHLFPRLSCRSLFLRTLCPRQ